MELVLNKDDLDPGIYDTFIEPMTTDLNEHPQSGVWARISNSTGYVYRSIPFAVSRYFDDLNSNTDVCAFPVAGKDNTVTGYYMTGFIPGAGYTFRQPPFLGATDIVTGRIERQFNTRLGLNSSLLSPCMEVDVVFTRTEGIDTMARTTYSYTVTLHDRHSAEYAIATFGPQLLQTYRTETLVQGTLRIGQFYNLGNMSIWLPFVVESTTTLNEPVYVGFNLTVNLNRGVNISCTRYVRATSDDSETAIVVPVVSMADMRPNSTLTEFKNWATFSVKSDCFSNIVYASTDPDGEQQPVPGTAVNSTSYVAY